MIFYIFERILATSKYLRFSLVILLISYFLGYEVRFLFQFIALTHMLVFSIEILMGLAGCITLFLDTPQTLNENRARLDLLRDLFLHDLKRPSVYRYELFSGVTIALLFASINLPFFFVWWSLLSFITVYTHVRVERLLMEYIDCYGTYQ